MSHTPEPWTVFVEPQEDGEIRVLAKQPYSGIGSFHVALCNTKADAERIANCVNGCAGFNPAAFRACVEALKNIAESTTVPDKRDWAFIQNEAISAVKDALAHAQE